MINEVSYLFAYLNGNYQFATNVNGKSSWKNDAHAIWYAQSSNVWLIGSLSDIGKDPWNSGFILASNDFSGITDNDNQWRYRYGQGWASPLDPNDIQITCIDGKYTLFTILLY